MTNYITGQTASIRQVLTANTTFTIPAGFMIDSNISFINTTGNAVTGGLILGTTDGGVDVMAALAVGANGLIFVSDALTLKRLFSTSVDTTIYVQAAVAWNSASVNMVVPLRKVT